MNETIEKRRATNPAWILIAVLGVVAAVTLTACGGKDSPSRKDSPSTSASATTPSTSPAKAGQPTYSQVVSTYPAGTVLNGTVATVTNVNANGDWTYAGGPLAGCGAVLSKYGPFVCYGSKLTIGDTSVTIDGTTYPPGTKLTTDKDLKLVQVSSWD